MSLLWALAHHAIDAYDSRRERTCKSRQRVIAVAERRRVAGYDSRRSLGIWALLLLLVSCAAPATGRPESPGRAASEPGKPQTPKRLVVAIMGEPVNLFRQLNAGSTVPGGDALEELISTGLGDLDPWAVLQPRLAESLPSIENGLWKTFPDGRMETAWRLRSDARWHDGVPLTAEDFVFALRLGQDRDQIMSPHVVYEAIEGAEAPDPRTVLVRWKRTYIDADKTFSHIAALPVPSHLLEKTYETDKAAIMDLPYWSTEFVGTGPFKLREFARGSHVLLTANLDYALGRPRVNDIEVRIILDGNTLMANVLADTIDLNLGRGLSFEQAMTIREQWKDGRADGRYSGLIVAHPQLIGPNPSILLNRQFRHALLQAIDRTQMADALHGGLVPVAEVWLGPNEPDYKEIEHRIVRYAYDPRRSAQILEGLGYRKGADAVLRDATDQKLGLEIRSDPADIERKSTFSVADYWQQLGVAVEPSVSPAQLFTDREYGATYPGVRVRRHQSNLAGLVTFHGARAPVPENRFVGSNYSRYGNPDLDALIDGFFTTIPTRERMQLLGDAIYHITEQVVMFPLFYNTEFTLVANRVANVEARKAATGAAQAWNSHQWELK